MQSNFILNMQLKKRAKVIVERQRLILIKK